jgi:OOP family OmpA-OmpF porin
MKNVPTGHLAARWTVRKIAQSVLRYWALPTLLMGLCTVGAQTSAPNGGILPLAEHFNLGTGVAAGQSRVIFYRPTHAPTRGAITVLVNAQYHASLVAGGYTYLCLTPGLTELGVRQMDVELRPNKDGIDAISSIDLRSGQTYFMRMDEQQGKRIFLRPVSAEQAMPELAATKLQVHTVSRVTPVQNCRTQGPSQSQYAEPVPSRPFMPGQLSAPVPYPMQGYQLAGDTLFEFNRSDRAGMTHEGAFAIQRLMQQIRSEYSRIDRIHVIGHADPLGSDYSNERLSVERANTVREFIEMGAQMNTRVTTEGRGSRELVVRHCSRVSSPQSMACNLPNRRVSVEVTGQRR